jgi:hypothetical protein
MQIEFFFHLLVCSLKQVKGLKKKLCFLSRNISTNKKRKKEKEEEENKKGSFFSLSLVKNNILFFKISTCSTDI